MNQFW